MENRWGHGDAAVVLVASARPANSGFHGSQVGSGSTRQRPLCQHFPRRTAHPAQAVLGDELRALRRLQREQEPKSPFVFTSERGAPFSTAGFARMVERAGSGFSFKAHPHMLRHACGYAARQQGTRYEGFASLPRPQEHPAYDALHRAGADTLQGFLAALVYALESGPPSGEADIAQNIVNLSK